MFNFIFKVFSPCTPLKIFQVAFCAVSILMTTLHSWRTRTPEGREDKYMNSELISTAKLDRRITFAQFLVKDSLWHITDKPATLALLPVRSHSAQVADFITGKIGDCLENFYIWSKMKITHGAGLLGRLAVWAEPMPLFTQPLGSFIFYHI